jgi:hypothetical protein
MPLMAKQKPGSPKASVPPSRKLLKYVPLPKTEWQRLKELGEPQERSVAYMVKQAVREFIAKHGGA